MEGSDSSLRMRGWRYGPWQDVRAASRASVACGLYAYTIAFADAAECELRLEFYIHGYVSPTGQYTCNLRVYANSHGYMRMCVLCFQECSGVFPCVFARGQW